MAAKKAASRQPAKGRAPRPSPSSQRFALARLPFWLLVVLPPLALSLTAKDNFRLPKLLLSELLALACLLVLAWRLRRVERVDLGQLWRRPVVRAVAPLLLAATATLLVTSHPVHVREALVSLWIGGATLIGLALGSTERELRPLLRGWIFMGVLLSTLVLVQAYVFNPFLYEGEVNRRIGLTSLAGGPFDLAGYLVLPALLLQMEAALASGRRRWLWGVLLLLTVFAIAQTQTLSALLAVGVGSLLFWGWLLPRRRFLAGLALMAILGGALLAGIEPLRNRLERKVDDVRQGRFNDLLTGRLDGWRGALWMWRQEPLLGVGHGAYRTRYGDAKLDLVRDGVEFSRQLKEPYFTHAHSEPLHVLAEWGSVGFLTLIWALFELARQARRRAGELLARGRSAEAAVMASGLAALAIMALLNFPFHLALIAYPALLFLGWIFVAPSEEVSA